MSDEPYIHIYTAALQPATQFTDNCGPEPYHFTFKAHKTMWANCCNRRRYAQYLVVQCYYDGTRVWCAKDRGCNHPRLIAAKRRREFRNRSAGQKRRRAK